MLEQIWTVIQQLPKTGVNEDTGLPEGVIFPIKTQQQLQELEELMQDRGVFTSVVGIYLICVQKVHFEIPQIWLAFRRMLVE